MGFADRYKPKRMPTPTRTASSSKRRPQEAIGSALSQSPAWGDATARSRALSCGVSTDDSRRALPFDTAGPSQLRCFMASVPVGGAAPIEPHHKSSMGATEGSGRSQLSPKMAATGERAWLPLTIERQTVRASPRYVSPVLRRVSAGLPVNPSSVADGAIGYR